MWHGDRRTAAHILQLAEEIMYLRPAACARSLCTIYLLLILVCIPIIIYTFFEVNYRYLHATHTQILIWMRGGQGGMDMPYFKNGFASVPMLCSGIGIQ